MSSIVTGHLNRFRSSASSQRIAHMFFAVFLGRGIMAMRQIIVVPLFLQFWGKEYYGEWLMISSIPTFLAMSNLGLGTSAGNQIAIDVAAGRIDDARRTYTTISLTLAAISCLVIVVTWLVCSFVSFGRFTHIEAPGLVISLLVAGLIPRMIAGLARGWWIGIGKPAANNHWMNILSAIELTTIFVVVLIGWEAIAVAFSILLISVCWLFCFLIATATTMRKRLDISVYTKVFSHRIVGSMLLNGLGHQMSPLWQALYFQGSILLAGSLFGPSGAAAWGAVRIFIRSGAQLLELVSQSVAPEFQLCYAQHDNIRLLSFRASSRRLSVITGCISTILLVTFGRQLFGVWTGGSVEIGMLFWFIACVSLVPFSIWWLDGELLRSMNKPWLMNVALVFIAGFSLLIAYMLRELGLITMGISALGFEILAALTVSHLANYSLRPASFQFDLSNG